MGKCKILSWKLHLKCKQLSLRSSSTHNWKQPSCQASALSNSWKTPLTQVCLPVSSSDNDCAAPSWKNPSTPGPTPFACDPAGTRTVSVTSVSLQLASQADPSKPEVPLSKAAQNGTDPNRLHRVLQGKCRCKKDCYKKFNFSQLKRLCVVFWKLSKNEQEHLAAVSDSRNRN